MSVYIKSAAQISIQQPLSEEWFDEPLTYCQRHVRAVEANYKNYMTPMSMRRMGMILKRAVVTSIEALKSGGTEIPDAIITGTGLGCIENTEKFLSAMVNDGESCLQPTFFINSTHNTISSHVATHLKCHGYNTTYAHLGLSFESGLMDAMMQIELGDIHNALVGGHDEMTEGYFALLDRLGYWKSEITSTALLNSVGKGSMAGETAVSLLLSDSDAGGAMARLTATELLYRPSDERLKEAIENLCRQGGISLKEIDIVMTGKNGDTDDDREYERLCNLLAEGKPTAWYKHLFGESFTASAYGIYCSAVCLEKGHVPQSMMLEGSVVKTENILIINHFQGREYSLTLLQKC